jgi:hypothetical protein
VTHSEYAIKISFPRQNVYANAPQYYEIRRIPDFFLWKPFWCLHRGLLWRNLMSVLGALWEAYIVPRNLWRNSKLTMGSENIVKDSLRLTVQYFRMPTDCHRSPIRSPIRSPYVYVCIAFRNLQKCFTHFFSWTVNCKIIGLWPNEIYRCRILKTSKPFMFKRF